MVGTGNESVAMPRPSRSRRQARSVARMQRRLHRHGGVDLPLRLWDGRRLGPRDPDFLVTLREPGSFRAMLWPPSDLAAGRAYVAGVIDIDGDVVAAIGAGAALGRLQSAPLGAKLAVAEAALRLPRLPRSRRQGPSRRARLRGRMHSRERDRMAVSFHYDLPAAFYEAFLDRGLTYSCAYFDEPMGDLERAQRRKLDVVCRKLRLEPGQRLLDIGCGFGSLVLHAAECYGVEAVGVTLSETQAEVGRRRVARAGLADRVEIRLADYRDVREQFDAVGSIGMIEHVGPDHLPDWFTTVRDLLRPGGMVLCHGIVMGDPYRVRRGDEQTFVSAYVFPDGGLVPAWRAVRDLQYSGLRLLDVEQLRPHYAWTLRHWISRLEANADRAVAVAGEEAFRVWRVYMAGSAFSFESGSLEVVQLLGRKPGPGPVLPVGREWMTPEVP